MKRVLVVALMLMLVLGTSTLAQAALVNLIPGDSKASGTAALPAVTELAKVNAASFTQGLITGNLTQWVYRDNSDNYLIFAYQVMLGGDPSANDAMGRMTTIDFAGWTTDAAYVAGTGTGTLPTTFDRTFLLQGATIGFDWDPIANHLVPGTTSPIMWIKTNATGYNFNGETHMIDGGTGVVRTYQPAVPEPASAMLLGVGLLGFVGALRRKFMA